MLHVAALTVLALLASLALTLLGWGAPVAVLHLAFAVGIVPLIFAAMSHFVPVLTRTGDPHRWIRRLPFLAQAAGLLAVVAMNGQVPRTALHLAAAVDLLLAAILLRWMWGRARACLGQPHPGWRWYGLALTCLMVALLAVPPLTAMPFLYAPLRLLHLHLNTLGLVGLAALGTLPVLLPTALGKPDPAAAHWLRARLFPVIGSVVLLAGGSALWWPMSLLGGGLLLVVVGSLLWQWQRCFGWRMVVQHGAASALLSATLGLVLVLGSGLLHGFGVIPAYPDIFLWAVAFLLPLVTGALSQLLPVWRWPGPVSAAREGMRQKLQATGVWRAALFFLSGWALLFGQPLLGTVLVGVAMGLFLVGLLQAVGVLRSTR